MPPKVDLPRLEELKMLLQDFSDDISETLEVGNLAAVSPASLNIFQARISKLDHVFERFIFNMGEAKALAITQQNENEVENLKILTKDTRMKYCEAINLGIACSSSNASNSSSISLSNVTPHRIKLPAIASPTFDGNISGWITFKETFKSLYHDNPHITLIEKFHYLKRSLKGASVQQTIGAIALQESNYTQAWKTLCRKHDNRRVQASHFLMKVLDFKTITKPTLESLNKFNESFMENATSLRNLVLDDPDGFILYTIGLRNLDPKTKARFESEHSGEDDFPSFDEFAEFIQRQCRQLQTENLTSKSDSDPSIKIHKQKAQMPYPSQKNHVFMAAPKSGDALSNSCPICKERHRIYHCLKFKILTSNERYEQTKSLRLCFNCLSPSHGVQTCPSDIVCKYCSKKHHSMLHTKPSQGNLSTTKNVGSINTPQTPVESNQPTRPTLDETGAQAQATTMNATVLSASLEPDKCVLLATACARIKDSTGKYHQIRLLVDSGSQRSFITTSCSQRIGLKRTQNFQLLKGFSDSTIQGGNYQARCLIVPTQSERPELETQAVIINHITNKVPLCPVPEHIYDRFSHLSLADPGFLRPGEVDFLLGADLFPRVLLDSPVIHSEGCPSAINTIFGWILLGSFNSRPSSSPALALHASVDLNSLDVLVKQFWENETPLLSKSVLSQEELKCEEHFNATHSRDEDGRYMVRLPFVSQNIPDLSDSKFIAEKRFKNFEYRLLMKNPDIKLEYDKIISKYRNLNYIAPAASQGKYVLPHHCVVRDAASTKVRIVFDGSSRSKGGSLNDNLLKGPKLQNDIRCVLLNFRKFKYAFTADIAQMYLQILIHPDDRRFQHFLYRRNNSEAIQEFQLNRVTFGLSSSPFLAIRVLHQLIKDEGSSYPQGSDVLFNNTYVDDILACAMSESEAINIQTQLIGLLKKGGFELKKWASNSNKIIIKVSNEGVEKIKPFPTENSAVSILGLQWETSTDKLLYKIQSLSLVLTKRGILSAIARMYDPLGYLTPIIFRAKLIMQNLWRENLEWDDPLPPHLSLECSHFFDTLPLLSAVNFPRCIFYDSPRIITLIGFADASTKGYAAVVYLRIEYADETRDTRLIISKSRLAPLQTLTVPRLELCAALLLIETIQSIKSFLDKIEISSTYLFTDSTVTLAWLNIPPNQLKTFVSHRVASITDVYSAEHWYHVRSEDNAADLPSRGTLPSEFCENTQWWKGPAWLLSDIPTWPISNETRHPIVDFDLPEVKQPSKNIVLLQQAKIEDYGIDINRFSNWSKLVRVFCLVKRFINKARKRVSIASTPFINLKEIQDATHELLKIHQNNFFDDSNLKHDVSLKSLAPFVDSSGLIRVGGRLKNSPLGYESKHPILLSPKSYLTVLLVDHFHHSFLHAGPTLLRSLLLRKYWIVSARTLCRQRVHKCLTCHRFRTKNYSQIMGDLPKSRFEQGRAFLNVGVDLAGPFIIKESHRRKSPTSKAYPVLFVCLSSKALHTEIVSSLSTESFIAALERFIARRGSPKKIMSWPVGRIIQTYPGADGAIRVVNIRTPSGEYIRPISKLAPLLPE